MLVLREERQPDRPGGAADYRDVICDAAERTGLVGETEIFFGRAERDARSLNNLLERSGQQRVAGAIIGKFDQAQRSACRCRPG